ncbi:MAG: M1 family metallopeptidase [Ignavibacteria bacterium]
MILALIFNIAIGYGVLVSIDNLTAKAETKTADVLNLAENRAILFVQDLFNRYAGNMNGKMRDDDAQILAMQNQFDVLNYDLSLSFDIPSKTLIGEMNMTANSVSDTLNTVYLNLFSNMLVDKVKFNDHTNILYDASFRQENDYIIITLNKTVKNNRQFEITVKYSGKPKTMGFDSFVFKDIYGSPVIYSLSEPTYGPTWWPSKDLPDDKALSSMHIRVPRGLTGVSNGLMKDSVQNDDGTTTFNWKTSYPIATYLISIVVANFTFHENTYTSLDNNIQMPVVYYIFPQDSAKLDKEWDKTPDMIHFYASTYGEYPFINEKYGMAEFGWTQGSMENQTLTSMGYLIGSDEDVVVHELSHQWFGDGVTLADWKNIWLNEGFATYSEALWHEHTGGRNEYLNYMKRIDFGYFSETVYNPNGFIFSPTVYATVYQKGGWVLHMLRGIVGDSIFFDIMRTYFSRFEYKNADTKDFQAVVEELYGQNMDWFFDEWVYTGKGRPKYEYSWKFEDFQDLKNTGNYTVKLNIKQVQDDLDVYKMPVKITIITENGDKNFTVFNDKREQDYVLATDSKPKEVRIDSEGWILKKVAKGKY